LQGKGLRPDRTVASSSVIDATLDLVDRGAIRPLAERPGVQPRAAAERSDEITRQMLFPTSQSAFAINRHPDARNRMSTIDM